MKRVLFIGEHPFSLTGNGNMLKEILNQINLKEYRICAFCSFEPNPGSMDCFQFIPFNIIQACPPRDFDVWGNQNLARIIQKQDFDILFMVGIDLWRYVHIFPIINELKKQKKFTWISLFPYDIQMLRDDWVDWIKMIDIPLVYSKYGYEMLKEAVPKIRYFRPPLLQKDVFVPLEKEERDKLRKEYFNCLGDDPFVFGFFGVNQIRKDPHLLIKAMVKVKEEHPEAILYLHTELDGEHNLAQIAKESGGKTGMIAAKQPGVKYNRPLVAKLMGACDVVINCSRQEGLSWTIVESLLCGVPVILSDTTAHPEIVEGKNCGVLVSCGELGYLPMWGKDGKTMIETKSCHTDDIAFAMNYLIKNKDAYEEIKGNARIAGIDWVNGCNNVNNILAELDKPKPKRQSKKAVLFAQHSSAGDVLMSTQCFKGIKERHPYLELHYMTQPQFQNIVEMNPYLDDIVNWDEELMKDYEIVYNPHGEKILPGGFNSLDATLHSMYPYFCKVEADDITIIPEEIDIALPDEFIVVHTTGGDFEYRGYKNMGIVIKQIDLPAVQIGAESDIPCPGAMDLRGKLSFRQTATVMKKAKAGVVIDSFPSHLAGAVLMPVVVLYGPAPARVVGPKGNPELIINLEPNKLDCCPNLTNCWGTQRNCQSPCINTLNPMTIAEKVKELLCKNES